MLLSFSALVQVELIYPYSTRILSILVIYTMYLLNCNNVLCLELLKRQHRDPFSEMGSHLI